MRGQNDVYPSYKRQNGQTAGQNDIYPDYVYIIV